MADELALPEGDDPFGSILSAPSTPTPEPAGPDYGGPDPFGEIINEERAPTGFESGARELARGLVPAAVSLITAGMGAEVGAQFGAGFGGGGKLVGGLIGGVAGGLYGAYQASTAQDFGLSMLPEDWQDFLHVSEEQRTLDIKTNPTESFIGGNIPYLLTMKPGGFGFKIASNATAYERIAASPITGRIFGGAVNGGMELGTELAQGEAPDPMKIGIATGFGMVFNAPNRVGARLLGAGEKIAQKTGASAVAETLSQDAALAAKMTGEKLSPTIAQAGDAKVIGPGITEEVFMGTHEQSPQSAMAAQDAVRTETTLINPEANRPTIRTTARDMEPELFSDYAALQAQRDDLTARISSILETPAPEPTPTVEGAAPVEAAPAPVNPEIAALRAQVAAVEAQLREVSPQIGAAMRRAADFTGGEIVEPDIIPAPETETVEAQAQRAATDEQVAAIAADMEQQLLAAGQAPEYAKAAGALISRRYATRASRLGRSDPLGLYQAEGAIIRRGNAPPVATPPAAPLMPTVDRPAIAPARVLSEATGVTEPQVSEPAVAPSEIESLDPSEIGVDAERFQFKSGGDEAGVTERLQGVEKWDPRLAGTSLVYRDEAGKNWIADGHQRLGLAKRLSETQPGIKINAFVLNAADGITDADARAIAAIKNIAEGTGSATDAAKVLRAAKETGIELPPLPPRSALVRDGRALANLSPEAFGIIVNEVVPTAQGAIVGRMVGVPEQQVEALRLLATLKPDNVTQAEMIVRDMLSTGTTEGRMESLFGAEDYAGSIVLERAKIADEAFKQLRRDKATFKTLVDEAERIQGAGANVLDQASNQSRLSTDEQAADFLKQLAFRAGPVSDALSEVARKLKAGSIKPGEAARTFLGDVRRAVEAGVVTGNDTGGPVAGAGEERPQLAELGYKQDNPAVDGGEDGREWLADKQADADKTYERNKGIVGAATARFMRPIPLPTDVLASLPGLRGEKRGPGEPQFDALMKKVDEEGWKQDASPILLSINHRGEPFIVEGNTRVAVAAARGEPTVRAEVKWMNGGELVDGEWAPSKVAALNEVAPDEGPTLFQSGRKPEPWKPGDMLGEFNTERGLEGLPQAVIPGAEVTDASRLKAAMAKPLAGGNAPPPKGGLFDVEGREDAADQLTLFQSAKRQEPITERNLYAVHNIKPGGVLNADKIGGLPMPSLAIARIDKGDFDSFGDISLIGSRDLIDPKGASGAKSYDADVYSPRYPSITRQIDDKAFDALNVPVVADIKTFGGQSYDGIDLNRLEDRGPMEALDAPGLKLAYLREKGIEIEPTLKPDGEPDWYANRDKIDAEIRGERRADYEDWADKKLGPLVKRERIFKGFDYNGNRRYREHTMDNVLSDMRARLKEGEGFQYGIGSIRSKHAKQFRSVEAIKKDADRITGTKQMDATKDEFGDRFFALADELKPFYKFEANAFGYADDVASMFGEMAKKGMRALDEGFENLPADVVKDVRQFLTDLADAPTEYFETKINRNVGLDEFQAALVPAGSSQRVIDALERAGLRVIEYEKGKENARTEAIRNLDTEEEASRILFQPAYHGTPHIFDKFDSSKIGTGEGNQAYGYGLYLSSAKGVAAQYRKTLAGGEVLRFDGTPLRDLVGGTGTPVNVAMENAPSILQKLNLGPMPDDVMALYPDAQKYADVPTYRALALREVMHGIVDDVSYLNKSIPDAIDYEIKHWRGVLADNLTNKMGQEAAQSASRLQIAEAIKESGLITSEQQGRLLTADVPESHELMNWDKPLDEQPADVKAKLEAVGKKYIPAEKIINGSTVLGWMLDHGYNDAHAWVNDMVEAGVYGGKPAEQIAKEIEASAGENYRQPLNNADAKMLRDLKAARFDEVAFNLDDGSGFGKLTAQQFYNRVSEAFARGKPDRISDSETSAALREAGIPGHEYIGHESQKTNYVIYDDSRINVTEYEQAKRGSIKLAEGQRPIITLFKDADASTFIHETGHQWLEELMRDARDEGVADVVKTDADTVRKWLGIGDDGKIATKSHEKFARGFEQYLREGVAPSAGLARVFAQFKSWLTQIYQSIRGLGAPINDDIKSVFDRMLELEPQRTVIDMDRDAAPSGIAGIHENDASTIEPAEADAALDRINAERLRAVAELPPEVQNELATAEAELAASDAAAALAGGEDGGGGGGPPAVLPPGAEPDALAPSPAGGSEPGAVSTGIGGAGDQGAGLPGRGSPSGPDGAGLRTERPSPADAARANPLAPSASTLFGPEESPFTDKAGNIRLENLTDERDVREAIHAAASENNDFIGDRRGVITDGQVMDLADALGMDAESLSRRQIGQAFNAEQIIAARKLLIDSATNLSAMAKRVAASSSTDEDVLAYAQARARHRMIQGHIAGITAEAGRALRAFRNIKGEMDQAKSLDQLMRESSARTLFQIKEEAKLAALLDTPQKMSKFMNDAEKPGFIRMVQEYWINALVSGPRTHVTNIVSNALFAIQRMGPETAAAAAIGAIRAAAGRKGERVRMGEVIEQFRRSGSSLPIATKAAIDALKAGRGVQLPEDGQTSLPLQPDAELAPAPLLDETATWAEVTPALFGLMQGLTDGIVAVGKLVASGGEAGSPLVGVKRSPLGAIPDIQVRGTTVLPVGTVARIPTRFLAASDSFFKAMSYSANKGAMALRQATEEGLTGAARDARVAQLYQNPDAEMIGLAAEAATEATFMSRESDFVKAFSRFANTPIMGVPIVKFVSPFINTPANIIEQTALHRTPLGLFSPEIRADLMGRNGNVAQDTAMAKMALGSAYAVAFGFLAAQGFINGSGPKDDNEKALWRLSGNQANSVRIGDTWYDFRALGPLGLLAGISADLYGVAGAADEEGISGAASQIMNAFIQNILNASFMTGPSDLIQALNDPERYGDKYVEKFLSSFIPSVVAQPAKAMDPYVREARNTVDAMRARLPVVSQQLLPKVSIWGEPLPSGTAFGLSGVSPIYTTQMTKDPVNVVLTQLGYWPGTPSRKIRGVELTDQQYLEYATLAGRMTKKRLDMMVTSPAFASWPPNVKNDVIREVVRQSREVARNMMMSRNPQIAADAVRLKMSPLGEE